MFCFVLFRFEKRPMVSKCLRRLGGCGIKSGEDQETGMARV